MALRVWLPLNGNLNNQGLSNINITNTGATINNNGKIGKCYEFGSNHWLKLEKYAAEFLTYKEFSLSVWFKCTAQNTSHGGSALISAGNWNQAANLLNLALGEWKTDHYSRLLVSGSGTWGAGYDYDFSLNTWYHVVLTSGDGAVRAYVNGELIGDLYAAFVPASLEQNWICIGNGTYYSGFIFNGLMNDVRIYDECLSLKQVKEISKGLIAHYKLDNPYNEATANLVPANIYNYTSVPNAYFSGIRDIVSFHGETCFSITTVLNNYTDGFICQQTENCTENEVYTYSGYIWIPEGYSWSVGMKCITGGGGIFHQTIVGNGEWQYFYQTFTANSNTSGMIQGYEAQNYDTVHTVYLKSLQLEKKDHPTPFINGTRTPNHIEDCGGNGYHGKIVGTIKYNLDSARYSGSAKFDANCANYIWRPEFTFLTGPLTYNCWVYQTAATPTTQFIMSQGRNYGTYGFNLGSVNGIPRMWVGGTAQQIINGSASLVDSKWHMLTGTWDGTTAKLYVDGVLASSVAMADIGYAQSSGAFVLGKMSYNYTSTTTYFPFAGSISDAKVYATALSADDILTMYKNSGIIDNKGNVYAYEFKEE